ncbi:Tafazzin [Sesamum angolense]|uniref:Tafazzin family protein n=1 Tax=Sesamum angolense TaxID=2727404 RepID=A0AAE1T601_9LAMI|nr:Tafazzin [Sesamum angolense]
MLCGERMKGVGRDSVLTGCFRPSLFCDWKRLPRFYAWTQSYSEKLQHAVLNRPENKSLITVSNHVAAMDDPLVIASLLPPGMLLDANGLRWTLCASDRCFKNPVTSAFFKYAKVLPVSRGDGIYQKGMDLAISKLKDLWRGGSTLFPEGSRSRNGGKTTMGSAKRGIEVMCLKSLDTRLLGLGLGRSVICAVNCGLIIRRRLGGSWRGPVENGWFFS